MNASQAMNGDSLRTGRSESPEFASAAAAALEADVRATGLLAPGRAVLVMLSGGRDSTALLHLAVKIAGQSAVTALHVNYGLRDAAGDDEQHCQALCRHHDVPLHVHRVRRTSGDGNLQAWAREVRYSVAHELARARDADVATGHTATDQVETILYRLASSPSRRALLGMRPRDGRLIRPLLGLTRQQTGALCHAAGLSWRDDATNSSRVYARGRARTRLLPALRELHPAAERNVLALAETLRAEADVLEELIDGVLQGGQEIEVARLRELPPALRALTVQRMADAAAGRPAPGTARRADELTALADHASLDLPHGVRAVIRRGILTMVLRENSFLD